MAEPSRGLLDLVADDDDDFEEEEWGDEGPAAAGAAATSPTPPPPPAVVDSSVATSADNSDSDTGSEPEHNGGAGLSSRARRASGRQRSKQSLALTNVSHHFLSQDSAAADGEEVLSHPDHQPLLTPTTPVSPPLFSRVRMRLAPSNPDDALRRRPYSDFTTINWAREVARERQRQKSLRSVMRFGSPEIAKRVVVAAVGPCPLHVRNTIRPLSHRCAPSQTLKQHAHRDDVQGG